MIKKFILCICFLCLLIFSIQSVGAANIAVHPGKSIQNVVNGASDGDNVTVYNTTNPTPTRKVLP